MIFKLEEKFEQKFVVSNEIYQNFIQTFQDKNPLHTDEEFATLKGFKGRVMHGNILSGFLSYFIGECLPTKNVIIQKQEIQFKNAVYLNDELHFSAEVGWLYELVNSVEFKFSFKNKEKKTVAKGNFLIGILK